MADRKINYKVAFTADDDLTPAAKDAAKALDKLEKSGDVEVALEADDKLTKPVKEAGEAVDKLDGAEAEVGITADDKATDDLKAVQNQAETLDKADAEVVIRAKIDAAEADLKALRQQLADLDGTTATADVDVDTQAATKGIKDLGTESDQTGSVMANMVGNTSQEIGELAGVSGTAGMALGQMAEYATEGNIALAKLGPLAAGIGLAAVAMKGLGDASKKVAEAKAFDSARVKGYTKALRDGKDEVEAIVETLREMEDIHITIGDGIDTIDVEPAMAKAGVDVRQFATLVAGSTDDLKAWKKEMIDAGADAASVTIIVAAAAQEQVRLGDATIAAAASLKIYGDAEAEAAAGAAVLEAATKAVNGATVTLGSTLSGVLAKALDEAAKASKDHADALEKARIKSHEVKDKQFELNTEIYKVEQRVRDQEAAWSDLFAEYDDKTSFNNIVLSLEGLKEELGGIKKTYDEGKISAKEYYAQTSNAIIEKKKQVAEYIAALGGIPAEKTTEINALIDQGKYDQVEKELAWLTRKRDMAVTVTFDKGNSTLPGPRMAGGPVEKGRAYIVGERRPELFVPNQSGRILPRVPTATALSTGGTGGGNTASLAVDAYLRDYPTAAEIAAKIGVVRVPVDAYLRSSPRITGVRE